MSDRYEDSSRPVVDCSGDTSLTQQAPASEVDMNEIMRRALGGAFNTHLNPTEPVYGSLIGLGDLREAMNFVVKANALFEQVDPFVRKRFHNDPAEMLEFVGDDRNREEATKLGLLRPIEVPKVDNHLETLKSIDASLKASGAKKSKAVKDED